MMPPRLPPQAWAGSAAGQRLLAALDAAGGATQLVGGAVRDALLGEAVKDVDLATRLTPDAVIERLEAAGLKAVPTGIAHGTVTAVADDLVAEVTTLRRDVATFGRQARVAFTDDWQADASRRDFTINALYAALPGGEISDFFGGLDDLAARRVRFIGDPLQRIAEDHLRILRFFRFSARFAGALDADGLAACSARANDLMALSRERIAMELRGLLGVADPAPTLGVMLDAGIFRPVLPEVTAERLGQLQTVVAGERRAGIAPEWQRRLAALLPAGQSYSADDVAARLRLSKADRSRLAAAVMPAGTEPVAEQAYWAGGPVVIDRLVLAGRAEEAASLRHWTRPALPASGRDIISRGISPGPEVARRLGQFERAWVAAGCPQAPEVIGAMLDQAAA